MKLNITGIKIMIVFLVFFISSIYSQEQNIDPNLITFPVSPEAGRLGTYGSVPVNLYTGNLNKSIDLFNTKIGDFNFPLTLSYSYNGNRVEEKPSIMGLGWQLNAGGVITREVRGLPDSYVNNYYNFRTTTIVGTKLFNSNIINNRHTERILNGYYDTEPDSYNLNVNGINFSFKIGLSGLPVFLSKHNNQVEVIRNDINPNQIIKFILTDSNSNKYYFEDIETSEQVSGIAFQNPNGYYDLLHPQYESSWQLTKIITNSRTITYQYQDDDFNDYQFYASGTYNAIIEECIFNNNSYTYGCNKFLIKRKLLSSITNELFTINFNIVTKQGVKVYDEINIQNPDTIIKFNFTYEGARNYLKQIDKNNSFFEGYSYDGQVDSFIDSEFDIVSNQDWWGFDNGVSNTFMVNVPNSSVQTDRSSNFYSTSVGALTKIEYATGGNTSIYYEQNKELTYARDPNVLIDLKFKTDNNYSAPAYKEIIFTKTFDTDVIASLSHYISDKNHIDLRIVKVDTNSSSSNYFTDIPSLRDSWNPTPSYTPNYIFYAYNDGCTSITGCPYPCNCTESKNSEGLFNLKAGTYMLKISSEFNNVSDASAEIKLSFYDENYPEETYVNVGGIHVSKTIDFDGQKYKTTYYDFNEKDNELTTDFNGLIDNTVSYELIRSFVPPKELGHGQILCMSCGSRNVITSYSKPYNLFSGGLPKTFSEVIESNNYRDIVTPKTKLLCPNCTFTNSGLSSDDNKITYTYVGDNSFAKKRVYPDGYKKHKFFSSSGGSSPSRIPVGQNLSKGRIESEEIFPPNTSSIENKTLFEKKYDYFSPNNSSIRQDLDYPMGIKVFRKKLKTGCAITNDFFDIDRSIYNNEYYDFVEYKETDSEYFTNSIYTKETFGNQNSIEQTTTINYDSHIQQKIITKRDSNNNILTKELYYPYDFSDSVSLAMVAKNCISPLVKIVNKKDDEIIGTTQFNYDQITSNLFKPYSFSKSKANNPLEIIKIYDYDNKGNVINIRDNTFETPERTTILDPQTAIIWGYNQSQIVAKLENIAYTSIPASLITAIQTTSNSPTATEAQVIEALNALRTSTDVNLQKAMITTYTHKPLIGVSTITDPKGDKLTYEYDELNRLKHVKDKDGNILSENEYHYKN